MAISILGSTSEKFSINTVSNTNTAYGVYVNLKRGTWKISTNPATTDLDIRAYNDNGTLVGSNITVTGGASYLVVSSSATSVWIEKRVVATGEDGTISSITPAVQVSLEFIGSDLLESTKTNFEVITSSGITPSKSGRATLVLVGGGMNGGASAGGTSVGGGGRTGHVNIVHNVLLTGSEISTVSAAISYGASNTSGETKLGDYSSLAGSFAGAADYGMNVTPIWENHKKYGTPAICGSTTSGRGGYNGNDWPAGRYEIGKGGNCGAGVTQNASGYGAGGGGGFWNGQGGGSGAPGIIYIAWL
jgi:hypothetical protein